jgi:hypothetical protein
MAPNRKPACQVAIVAARTVAWPGNRSVTSRGFREDEVMQGPKRACLGPRANAGELVRWRLWIWLWLWLMCPFQDAWRSFPRVTCLLRDAVERVIG